MTQPVGIVGSQSASRTTATTSRDTSKGRLKKLRPYLVILVVLFALLNWWRNIPDKESFFSSTKQAVPTTLAQWKQTAGDGTIPVGVWSESTMLPPGSSTFFDAGNGTVYQIRYRLYRSEWKIHDGAGSFPAMDEIQFKALQPGLKKIPFTNKYQ